MLRALALCGVCLVLAPAAARAGEWHFTPSFGVTFDTLIDPLDRAAFGDPSDIDGNSRIVLFFTKAVNDLTPTTSTSYVGGFFHGRDLFPTKETADFAACARASRVAPHGHTQLREADRRGA